MTSYDFTDKVVVITGGASGIGRAAALAFSHACARTIILDIDAARADETLKDIAATGHPAEFQRMDVSDPESIASALRAIAERWGKVDCAVNNAGISGPAVNLLDYAIEDWDRLMSINLRGVWLSMKYELPLMLTHGGAIVNMASVAGLVGAPTLGVYAAAKHGVVGLTKTAALEYIKSGVRVNCVCPSFIDTPMVTAMTEANPVMKRLLTSTTPANRLGTPEEVAEAILWLCSDGASFVNGAAISVDGGYVAR
jgi:NAD(P)-dependent dehydrogenase (short-subunit alcohol dehydrogenase family)